MTSTTFTSLNTASARWQDLALLSEEELESVDVAVLNLAAAQGFPDAPTADQAEECLRRLDHYAWTVADYTETCSSEFDRYRDHYQGSEGRFRVLKMVSMLQQVHGIRYNPAKIPDDSIHSAGDAFIHGPLIGEGGTCASIPVVLAAVGRRLGYPIRMVSAPSHLFARWDDGEDYFNIDVTNEGLCHPPDDFYRHETRTPFGEEQERYCCYLQSQSTRHEFSNFLFQRAWHWYELNDFRQSVEALSYAIKLAPEIAVLKRDHHSRLHAWHSLLLGRMPLTFPTLRIHYPPRRYAWLSEEIEERMIFCEMAERLLDDPGKAGWWEALRKSPSQRPRNVPTSIQLTMAF